MLCYDSGLQVDLGRTVVSSHFIPLALSKKPVTVGDRVELLLAALFHTAVSCDTLSIMLLRCLYCSPDP